MELNSNLLFFSGTLIFIVVNIYGGALKALYRPQLEPDFFTSRFPAKMPVALYYLVQLLQIPYLLCLAKPKILLYANSITLLSLSSMMVEMYEGYFFKELASRKIRLLYYLPFAMAILVQIFLAAIPSMSFTTYRAITTAAVGAAFCYYLYHNVQITIQLKKAFRRINEKEYSNPGNFTYRTAQKILWSGLVINLVLASNFLANNPWAKLACDLILSNISFWFTLMTLDPLKLTTSSSESLQETNKTEKNPLKLLSLERAGELANMMKHQMDNMHLYTDPEFTVDKLTSVLGTNRNYINEVIQFSGYKSFFDMVNSYRVDHAAKLLVYHPEKNMYEIAEESGFSSQSYMSRTFKLYKEMTPSNFRKKIQSNESPLRR